jgi:3-phosphoshikimate 1-carboxyvinyltransferase
MLSRKIVGHKGIRLAGTIEVPGDKSIGHRILIMGSLARGTTFIRNLPDNDDIDRTIDCLRELGVKVERSGDASSVTGIKESYRTPDQPLDCGGSATTMRILLGALAGRCKEATLIGDGSLLRRPMDRITKPLRQMGIQCQGRVEDDGVILPPITLQSPDLAEPVSWTLNVASAQVKTALILAGMGVKKGRTILTGSLLSRDHTERLVPQMGGSLVVTDDSIIVEHSELNAIALTLPGDPSSAAFFAAGAALLTNSQVTVNNVGLNPSRMGFFEALNWMGGSVKMQEARTEGREPVGQITVRHRPLHHVEVPKEAVPSLIDELPLLILLATQATGTTRIHGISELYIKECDRIGCTVEGLTRMGASIDVTEDTVTIAGQTPLKGAELDAWGDHRMSMLFTVAAYAAHGDSNIIDTTCESKSYPEFYSHFQTLVS